MVVRSSLIRSFDIKEKSSKWLIGILIASLISFYIWSIYSGNGVLEAVKHSLVKTMGFYLSWCFSRELDPDAKVEAFYGLAPLFIIFIFGAKCKSIVRKIFRSFFNYSANVHKLKFLL